MHIPHSKSTWMSRFLVVWKMYSSPTLRCGVWKEEMARSWLSTSWGPKIHPHGQEIVQGYCESHLCLSYWFGSLVVRRIFIPWSISAVPNANIANIPHIMTCCPEPSWLLLLLSTAPPQASSWLCRTVLFLHWISKGCKEVVGKASCWAKEPSVEDQCFTENSETWTRQCPWNS